MSTSKQEAFHLLGWRVVDKISGFAGVVTSVNFDLYGCVQLAVHPGCDKDGKIMDALWFDLKRLRKNTLEDGPVMSPPSFDTAAGAEQGGDAHPAIRSMPMPK